MGRVAVLQQQEHRLVPYFLDPWQYWSAETIAAVSGASVAAVRKSWPLIVQRLVYFGINTRRVQAASIATIAIETASTFLPVREAFWLDDRYGYEWAEWWRYQNLWYYGPVYKLGYYGRGYVQLTHEGNYREEGLAIGVDLVGNPDLALRPDIAADSFARFFLTHNVAVAADALNWPEVRRRVQGGYASLDRLTSIGTSLLAA